MVSSFADMEVFNWLKANCQSKVLHVSTVLWSYVFSFAIWNLWKHRNGMVFNNSTLNRSLHSVSKNQALEYYYCVGKMKSQKNKVVYNVRWEKPPLGWCKLNTDGTSYGNPGRAGGGGVIRDSEGRWLKGFARSIGFTTNITVEFWALRDGLMQALQMGVQNLVVELDAKVVVKLVQSHFPSNAYYSSLLADCRSLLGRF
nr:putative ribonuclease h protein [Quercus suber]